MTLAGFVRKNAFRNRRRSALTILSIAFSLLLLTFFIELWMSFFVDQGNAESARRLIVRHKVSLTNFLPQYYRDEIRTVPGVLHVLPITWFAGVYKDSKPEHFFARFGTDPDEFFDTYRAASIPADQLEAWKKDRAGAIADVKLAKRQGWQIGDRIVLKGDAFPVTLNLTLRGLVTNSVATDGLYFNWKYVEESLPSIKGRVPTFVVLIDSPRNSSGVAAYIDDKFSNAPEPTLTETENALQAEFVSMLGNVKAFIGSISLAVVFTMLLVSANTMAMSIRERTREIAVLRTLGFHRETIVKMFISESVGLAFMGGALGWLATRLLVFFVMRTVGGRLFDLMQKQWWSAFPVAIGIAVTAGIASSLIPSYSSSRIKIVEGLRHLG
jgi:putative ABC transport system permease protein